MTSLKARPLTTCVSSRGLCQNFRAVTRCELLTKDYPRFFQVRLAFCKRYLLFINKYLSHFFFSCCTFRTARGSKTVHLIMAKGLVAQSSC